MARPRSQPAPWARMWAMKSSVTGGQRQLGDVELVLGDEAQQQVERALEAGSRTWNAGQRGDGLRRPAPSAGLPAVVVMSSDRRSTRLTRRAAAAAGACDGVEQEQQQRPVPAERQQQQREHDRGADVLLDEQVTRLLPAGARPAPGRTAGVPPSSGGSGTSAQQAEPELASADQQQRQLDEAAGQPLAQQRGEQRRRSGAVVALGPPPRGNRPARPPPRPRLTSAPASRVSTNRARVRYARGASSTGRA